ncbi:THUMP-like domain-containing protein [Lacipirellula sp.]|uniref:THUMP-like domain-containing protein n=1 Tax=Lacipirellula sp. TaxID=2691419 RepID=UPI003D0C97FC
MVNLDDYAWLTGDEAAAAALAAYADDPRSELQQQNELRKQFTPERARLVLEQIGLRRRGVQKFGPLAMRMFFAPVALEQATDGEIAAYKAARFRADGAGRLVHDYCCGIGGDLLALAAAGPAIGWDSSPVVRLLAEQNLAAAAMAVGVIASQGEVREGDVAELTPDAGEAWHVDPDRRADGRRSTTLENHSPGPEVIDRWRAAAPDGAVKLSPASTPPKDWEREGELEWITSQRECRQLVAWFGQLALAPGQRRATIALGGSQSASFVGEVEIDCVAANEPLRYVYDPDPSLIAAHLLGAIAEHHELTSLGAGGVYLTGDEPIADPLLASFAIEEVFPLRVAAVGSWLSARNVGKLEVKKRGVTIDPEKFRRDLKLRGDDAATLILTRIGKRQVAIVARRLATAT